MTNFLRSPNRRRVIFTGPAMAGALVLGLLSGCSEPRPPIDYNDTALILGGDAPWGEVRISARGSSCVTGELPWGDVDLCKDGDRISGDSPWGDVDVKVDDGHVTGEMPWGDADVTIDDGGVTGELPWGDIDLELSGDRLSGEMPWGDASLRLGKGAENITSPLAVTALVALMSDKT